MRTQLANEIDTLIALYITNYKGDFKKEDYPSQRFPNIFKFLEAIRDMEGK